MKKSHNKLLAMMLAAAMLFSLAACGSKTPLRLEDLPSGGAEVPDDSIEYIVIDEPVKSFLKSTLPDDYSFYTLSEFVPVTMDDLRKNGIYIGSRVPDGLLPSGVIEQIYGGGFVNGTVLTMGEGSAGMDKFDGIGLLVCVGITPGGCVNSMRDSGEKRIILFSEDDAVGKSLIKLEIK